MQKGTRVKNIIVHDSNGNRLMAGESDLVGLYLNTVSFDVATVNSFSATSIIETVAKMGLLN